MASLSHWQQKGVTMLKAAARRSIRLWDEYHHYFSSVSLPGLAFAMASWLSAALVEV